MSRPALASGRYPSSAGWSGYLSEEWLASAQWAPAVTPSLCHTHPQALAHPRLCSHSSSPCPLCPTRPWGSQANHLCIFRDPWEPPVGASVWWDASWEPSTLFHPDPSVQPHPRPEKQIHPITQSLTLGPTRLSAVALGRRQAFPFPSSLEAHPPSSHPLSSRGDSCPCPGVERVQEIETAYRKETQPGIIQKHLICYNGERSL